MEFRLPGRLLFGAGRLASLPELVSDLSATRPFVVSDRGLAEGGVLGKVTELVDEVGVFDGVEANPRVETIDAAVPALRKAKPDLVIAVGGGSVLDAAKALALLATNDGSIAQYEGRERYAKAPLPLIAIPTTCGTGSEATWVAVITDTDRQVKFSVKGPEMMPAAALVDPDLLATLPAALVASTGMDALTHAIEAYTVRAATPMTDFYALRALELIARGLEPAVNDVGSNGRARADLMLGSTMAGLAFGNSDVGAVHCLSESLGGLLDVPHGVANAVFLPHVLRHNLSACSYHFEEITRHVGMSEHSAEAFIDHVVALSSRLGIPSLAELGVSEDYLAPIARLSVQNGSNGSNAREMTEASYLTVLRAALGEES